MIYLLTRDFSFAVDHIGVHKSNYTCDWTTCARRGLPQTSRFSLISHIQSHTGEKPFDCPLPGDISESFKFICFWPKTYLECDSSFTRWDALAKHMRLQHKWLSLPDPGKGDCVVRKVTLSFPLWSLFIKLINPIFYSVAKYWIKQPPDFLTAFMTCLKQITTYLRYKYENRMSRM